MRFAVAVFLTAALAARACTIFVLTDTHRTLFFNNEDWFNPATRLWFVPAGSDHLGCAFVGFDNGWAQGGVNSAGLAFDWVSGFDEKNYQPAPALQPVRGNPAERMLESCRTVDEAIAFFRKYREPDFARSRILVADRTGASAAIGSHDGKFHVAPLRHSRGFGYGRTTLEQELAKNPQPTLANGTAILRACLQPGDGGTKYSNVFDLNSGEIVVFPTPSLADAVHLDLAAELAKGGHFYDLPHLREQLAARPRPLPPELTRFYLDRFTPLADQEPAVTSRVASLLRRAAAGELPPADFAPDYWAQLAPARHQLQTELAALGELRSLTLVERAATSDRRTYRFIGDFPRARILQRYELDADGAIVATATEFAEPRSN